ncbi:hypothetical protein BN946_scf184883.g15 [Trametes cinnabarina]|uniref:Uncharacterized protein n=1 Tax=Pycnoporus cinnabarinus TaxID=5643 RepID=A0A060SSW2_PYCCI|nr:hypothetical protein BN946_scf184883.g15 [Trametes cinnabarina]
MPESVSYDNLFFFIADDADYGSVTYGGLWLHNSTGFANHTYKSTGSKGIPGSTATFNFSGIAIGLKATIPNDLAQDQAAGSLPLPNISVALDNEAPVHVSVPLNTSDTFWERDNLTLDATHTLTVQVDNTTHDFPFVLDAFLYARPIEPSSTGATYTPPGSQQRITPTSSGDSGRFLFGFAPDNQAPAYGASSGLPVAAIVGGVVGGVTLLLATALAFYFMCVRAKQLKLPESMVLDPYRYDSGRGLDEDKQWLLNQPEAAVTAAEYSRHLYKRPQPSETSAPGSQVSGGDWSLPYDPSRPGSLHSVSPRPASTITGSESASNSGPLRGKAAEAGILSVPRPPTYHMDSGVRFVANNIEEEAPTSHVPPGAEVPTDVPPQYSAN